MVYEVLKDGQNEVIWGDKVFNKDVMTKRYSIAEAIDRKGVLVVSGEGMADVLKI